MKSAAAYVRAFGFSAAFGVLLAMLLHDGYDRADYLRTAVACGICGILVVFLVEAFGGRIDDDSSP